MPPEKEWIERGRRGSRRDTQVRDHVEIHQGRCQPIEHGQHAEHGNVDPPIDVFLTLAELSHDTRVEEVGTRCQLAPEADAHVECGACLGDGRSIAHLRRQFR